MSDATTRALALAISLVALAGCGDDGGSSPIDTGVPDALTGGPDAGNEPNDAAANDAIAIDAVMVDAMADATAIDALIDDPDMPTFLRSTGLYSDFDNEILAPGVREYRPSVELWSDSATKTRYILLPADSAIDTSDMDFWQLPVGTKVWKEFTRADSQGNDVRVETRLLSKLGESQWFMMSYAWNPEQSDAVAAPLGASDALGTEHDIPSQVACQQCHLRMPDIVIGFTALSLDHTRDPGAMNELVLDDLIASDLLSDPPAGPGPTYFTVPGDSVERDALEYLHVNCGNCHNPESDLVRDGLVAIELRLLVDQLATVQDTPAYRTTVDVPPQLSGLPPEITALIASGDPGASAVHFRMSLRDAQRQMPPVGTEQVDSDGLAKVAAWIRSLAAPRAGSPPRGATPGERRNTGAVEKER